MSLTDVIETSSTAAAFYRSLHPSVRKVVNDHAESIAVAEDLYAAANNAMTENLRAFGDIYDDSEN